ncbi:MAG: ABC transporter permease [Eubacteriales bacterium]|nr:ABC transporter permease [Eubacteriales bacterium]
MRSIKWAIKKTVFSLGGYASILVILAVSAVSFLTIERVLHQAPSNTYMLGIVNFDEGELGDEVVERMGNVNGITLTELNSTETAQRMIENGQLEAWAQIPADYSQTIKSLQKVELIYHSASGSLSEQFGRETLSFENIRLLIRYETYQRCRELYDNDEECARQVDAQMKKMDSIVENQYTLTRSDDIPRTAISKSLFSKVFAKQTGVVTLLVTFVCAAMLQYMTRADVCGSRKRSLSIINARRFVFASDYLAYIFAALIIIVVAKICMRKLSYLDCLKMLPYVLCISSICHCYAQTRKTNGAIDMLTPFVVLATCFIGGCFFDIGSVSSTMQIVSCISPAGLLIYGIDNASAYPSIILLVLSVVFLTLGYIRNKKSQ